MLRPPAQRGAVGLGGAGEQRDKSVASAIDPILRRYQSSLEALLRRATSGGDLDSALKIKEELSKLSPASVSPVLTESAYAHFFGSWAGGAFALNIMDNHTVIDPRNGVMGRWDADDRHLTVTWPNGYQHQFPIRQTKNQLEGTELKPTGEKGRPVVCKRVK